MQQRQLKSRMPKQFKLSEAGERGWFVGSFEKAVFKTTDLEAGYQVNLKGETSKPHFHKIATEINLIVRGAVLINGELYTAGMGVIFYPNEVAECVYLEDTETMVIKTPGALNDKYLV